MTGTDPKTGDDAEKERNQGLARSLFRVSLPRWRGGRYSLSKLFFNFYLLAMGSFVAIAFTADFVAGVAFTAAAAFLGAAAFFGAAAFVSAGFAAALSVFFAVVFVAFIAMFGSPWIGQS